MDKEKEKKKTLTISSNFKKKLIQDLFKKNEIESHLLQSLMIKKTYLNHQKILEKWAPDQNFKNQENKR